MRSVFRTGASLGCLFLALFVLLRAGLPDRAQVLASGFRVDGIPIEPEVGASAPPVESEALIGDRIALQSGQPTVLNFWATWCGPCIAEIPLLETTYQKNKVSGLQLIGVNIGEDRAIILNWLAARPVSFPIALDPNRILFERYRVRGVPSTFFIDRRGIIRRITYGTLTESSLNAALEEIIKG